MKNFDPDISELREFIANKFSNLLERETLQTDGEIAIYWFASEYHSGQSSNLYKALCTIDYNPGRMINNVLDENEIVCMIFNFLVEKYDPDGDNFIVNAETEEIY